MRKDLPKVIHGINNKTECPFKTLSHNFSSCSNWLIWHFEKDLKMWTIFNVFIEFVTVLLLFYTWVLFVHKAREILAPWPGLETAPLALGCEVPILTFLKLKMSISFFKVIHDTHLRKTQFVVREEYSEVEWKNCRAGNPLGSVLTPPSIPWVTREAGTHSFLCAPLFRICALGESCQSHGFIRRKQDNRWESAVRSWKC